MTRVSRRPTLLLLAAAALCIGGCGNPVAPRLDVSGTWVEPFDIPGPSFTIQLTQRGASVTGNGTYRIEAGASGTLSVAGSYERPGITLTFEYDYGSRVTFSGAVVGADIMTGTVADSTGHVTRELRLVHR